MKTFCIVIFGLLLIVGSQGVYAQQPLAQQAFAIFEQHCLNCHGEFGSYSDVLTIKHKDLIEDRAVIPGQPDASELYLRLLGDTDSGSQMPLGQEPLDSNAIATIRRWIEAGAPDWEKIPKPNRRFITTEAMLKTIHTHVTSLTAFDRSFARYFTLTHLYNAGASDDNLRAYRNALSKLVNSLSWGAEVIKPVPVDPEETIFYIDLRHYEWDIKSDKWYKIEQAYPYGVQLVSPTYTTLCQETACELPFVRADWFIATASLPPLYHEILGLPETDKELETYLEVNVAENLKNAPGVRVWRAGFSESGVSVNNRIVERHKSRYGAYWKSYDFAGNVGTQNIFTHPLNFTHDGGEIIFNLPNGLQAYYLSTATGERLDAAPINIVSDAGARDPVVRNGLSCMGCHTEGMKTFEDQMRSVIQQNLNPSYDKAQALRLYTEKSEMDGLVREDIARYRRAIEAAGGVFGGSEPIQQLVKQFEGPLDAAHAAAEVGLETDDFLKTIRENSGLQAAGLLVLGVEDGTVKRDAWGAEFGTVISALDVNKYTEPKPEDGLVDKRPYSGEVAVIETAKGTIEFEFFAAAAPETSKDFIKNANMMYYKGEKFNRAEELLIQAGSKLTAGNTLPIENGFQEVARGRVGMSKSEFFICRGDAILDSYYTIFGNVISGMDVVDSIVVDDVITNITIREKEQPLRTLITEMVLIPAGEFQMGSNDSTAEDDEKPLHLVYLDAFYIDKYEVTNAQYKAFVDANPEWQKDLILSRYHDSYYLDHWNGNNYPIGKGSHPVVYVSQHAAAAYSKWIGKRLPTEAEWEKAARGGLMGQKYPWGNSIDPSKTNYDENIGGTTPVGQYAPNAYGLYDMAGNVSEWCIDEYDRNFYARSPRRNPVLFGTVSATPFRFRSFVLRGGHWRSRARHCSTRSGYAPRFTSFTVGFRCARSVKP